MPRLLIIAASIVCLLNGGFLTARGNGDVEIHLNSGSDVVYQNGINRVEIWIKNDALLQSMSLGFQFSFHPALGVTWDTNYGGSGCPVLEHGDAVDVWNLGGLNTLFALDGLSTDSLLFGGGALYGGLPPHYPEHTLCYSLRFTTNAPTGTTFPSGFCIDNIFYPPGGYWFFDEGSVDYPPDFNGNSNYSPRYPDAPPVCFNIVAPSCGDTYADGIVNVSDVVYLITFIFAGGPEPQPLEIGDVDCNELVNVSDVVYLTSYIFNGGSPPCADCP